MGAAAIGNDGWLLGTDLLQRRIIPTADNPKEACAAMKAVKQYHPIKRGCGCPAEMPEYKGELPSCKNAKASGK